MTLSALKFERKKEQNTQPRALFRTGEVLLPEQRWLPAGRRCEGPASRASALATQRETARATKSRGKRQLKLQKHMCREQAQGGDAGPRRCPRLPGT